MVNEMHSTFLKELYNFIKEGNYFRGSYKKIYISNKFLPLSFRRVIVKEARKFNWKCELDDSFILTMDKDNKHLCMIFSFLNGKSNILVKDTQDHIYLDERYTPLMMDDVLLEASKGDVRKDLYYAGVDALVNNKSYSEDEAKKISAQEVDRILQSFTDKDFIEGAKIEESLNRIIPLIENYIYYMSELYRTNVEEANSDVIVLPNTLPLNANIVYSQNKSHRDYSDAQSRIAYSSTNVERVNEVIESSKRQKILQSLSPIAEGTCLNSKSDEIDYYVYLYKISDTEYKFIFEPLSGKKCTKLINFIHDGDLSFKEIEDYAIKYLSMSEDEIIECDFAARFNHTTEETYNIVIPYAITMDETKYKCPYGTKNRIDGLSSDKIESLNR